MTAAFSGASVKDRSRGVTQALEIFGLTDGEIGDIESGVFGREFKDIDLTTVAAARPRLGPALSDYALSARHLYLGDSAGNMKKAEKESIEVDILGERAVIFEENADDIRRVLANYRKNKGSPPRAYAISATRWSSSTTRRMWSASQGPFRRVSRRTSRHPEIS